MRLGPYEVVNYLGQGGMGTVVRARAPDGREVAIKMLRKPDSGEAVARFERERRLVQALGREAGFVPLLDAGETASGPYLVMPFLAGGTLRDRLEKGPLPVDDAIALLHKLSKALGHAHERGIMHRDLKPENVLFTDKGEPLVADLGLAKHFEHTSPGASQSVAL